MARRSIPKVKKRVNSRNKGKTGELEFAAVLKGKQLDARRGQQFHGGPGSPDVVCSDLPGVHFEVKRVEGAKCVYDWWEQAKRDGVGKISVIAHRQNGQQWLAILDMEDLLDLLILREGTLL